MKTFCHLIGKYFGIIAVVFLILGMTVPDSFKWVVGNIGGIPVLSTLLGVIMFGMGTTLNLRDFALVLKRPVDVFVGVCAQYLIMPSLAFLLAMAFNLDPALTAGVVLVGTCPGGTSSNVITFMSKGDLALSVTMTSVSTLLSPILTPLITYQLIGQKIAFDPLGMFWSIIQIVIIPICLGLAVKALLPKLAEQATDYLPAVSAIAISLIIAGVIAVSRDNIVKTSGIILLVVIACIALVVCFLTDPVDSKTEEPADTIVSNTENTPDSADTTLEESSQPTVPSEPEQPTEQDVLKGALSTAEETDTSILDELISNAVLDHYADAVQPGQIHVESHVTLAEDKHDTQSVTVYLLVLQEIYSVDGESLTLENGSYIPTAITFSLSTSGGAPIEYWEPSDGSYSDDIRAKFPAAAADEALNDQAYIDALRSACEEQAQKARTSTQG